MSWLGWGPATNPQYEELVEKACSPLNLPFPQSEDISVNLEITDMIRSKAVLPKPAMQSLKRRVASRNGRVQMYAFSLVDTCIKNGGDHFLAEIASKEFVDEMSSLIQNPMTNAEVKQMASKFFQQWALAFQSKKELAFFVDVYHEMKNSGTSFPPPPAQVPSHLLETVTAPTWIDSDVCMRCRTAFTFTNRKHHCRNCGLVFDQACSSRTMPLPHFGIKEPVRVCESCFVKSGKGKIANGTAPVVPGRTPRTREDLDADLQRAIELSLAESRGSGMIGSEPPLARKVQSAEDDDEELRLAIEASLREMEKARPSAPAGAEEPEYRPLPTFDLSPREAETVLTFSNTLDQMAAYGERDLRRFPHAHVLYEQAYGVGGKLHRNVEEKSTKQQMLSEIQAKLSEAVNLYGQILDGQQAYSARKLQEQQQQQYQQSLYNPYQPQQYAPHPNHDDRYASPVPHTNGYATYASSQPAYQYQSQPQAQSQFVPNAPAAPSLYPAMPNLQQPQIYPNAGQQHPYRQNYRPEASTPVPSAYAPQPHAPQVQQYPTSPQLERHRSLRQIPSTSHPGILQRHSSMTHGAPPESDYAQGYDVDPTPAPSQPSAPPVDLSTHPTASPTSTVSALPDAYRSPSQATPNLLPAQSSSQSHTHSYQKQPQAYQASPQAPPYQSAQWQQPLQSSQPAVKQAPVAQLFQQEPQTNGTYPHSAPRQQAHQQQQTQPQQMYSAASFPEAPAAVFPDAPSAELQGVEQKEQEEVMLIEL